MAAGGADANATGGDSVTIKISDAKLYVPVVILSTEDKVKLTKQLNKGFKRSAYWSEYKVIDSKKVDITNANDEEYKRELLDSSYQRVKRLFFLAYDNTEGDNLVSVDSFKKSFLPTVKMQNYNIEIDGRNFKDQSINDSVKKYDKFGKVWTGQSDNYTTGCLLDFTYFKNIYRLNAADLSKQKALDGDSRAIQQIIFTGNIKQKAENTKVIIYYFLEKSKERSLKFSKRTRKVL